MKIAPPNNPYDEALSLSYALCMVIRFVSTQMGVVFLMGDSVEVSEPMADTANSSNQQQEFYTFFLDIIFPCVKLFLKVKRMHTHVVRSIFCYSVHDSSPVVPHLCKYRKQQKQYVCNCFKNFFRLYLTIVNPEQVTSLLGTMLVFVICINMEML